MIDNSGHVLWDAEKEAGAPKDNADWLELEDHATQLAAAGTLELKALPLPSLMPYLDGVLAGKLVAGTGELRLPHRFAMAVLGGVLS